MMRVGPELFATDEPRGYPAGGEVDGDAVEGLDDDGGGEGNEEA